MNQSLQAFFERSMDEILADDEATLRAMELLAELEAGRVRAAELRDGEWTVCVWVKQGILSLFRLFPNEAYPDWPGGAVDRSCFAPRALALEGQVRVVAGGTSVRRGACLRPGAILMPPAFVNVGAWVGEGSMVDSHALVGSCAQIGSRVHLSAGAQIGGVLEPAGARPVIIEDECFIGALTGLFEGVLVGERAVLAPGTIISAATTIYDLVRQTTWRGRVPAGAVVVPGTRPPTAETEDGRRGAWAARMGISLYAPCIVKYRDDKTDAATALEGALR